jgi:hypothetical protein
MAGKNRKFLIAIAVISMLAAAGGSLYAEPYLFSSPQKYATATQFRSDADKFIDVRRYAGLEFDKFFGAISFQNSNLAQVGSTNMMQFGAAANFGKVYTALYYGGNALALPPDTYREYKGKKVYSAFPKLVLDSGVLPYNEASVLIGVADMGFRLSFVSTYNSKNLKDFYYGSDPDVSILPVYKSYQGEHGSLNPQIAWGMARELIPDKGLKPHVYIDLDFWRDYEKFNDGTGEQIKASNNVFTFGFTAAAGGFSLVNNNGFDLGVDLWYTLNLKGFDNEYSPVAGKIVSFKGVYSDAETVTDKTDDYYRTEYVKNLLTPYLYASWTGDRVSLSAELGLELGLISDKRTQFDLNGNSPVKEGFDSSAFAFTFKPVLDLGMQWTVVRDKFYVNVGSEIKILSINSESADIDNYTAGAKVGSTEKEYTNIFDGASTDLRLGVNFNITQNLGVQAVCGIANNNNLSLFGSSLTNGAASQVNGLAVFSQIMATLKF